MNWFFTELFWMSVMSSVFEPVSLPQPGTAAASASAKAAKVERRRRSARIVMTAPVAMGEPDAPRRGARPEEVGERTPFCPSTAMVSTTSSQWARHRNGGRASPTRGERSRWRPLADPVGPTAPGD
ncbi:MAG: hypothetical protein QM820_48845 [Minicystis sp.]